MAGTNQSSKNRTDKVLLFLAACLLLTLANATNAGAQCNQVCDEDSGQNTFFGNAAGASTTGGANSGFGFGALQSNPGGMSHTAVGSGALQGVANGSAQDTAIGWNSLFSLTGEDDYNTATGSQALTKYSANNNTATGANALHDNTGGNQSTANGANALYSSTTGVSNTATGMNSLNALNNQPSFSNTGYNNTADGYGALLNNTSGYNQAGLGVNTLNHNTTGISNVAMGINAGKNLTTGSNNIDIGGLVAGADGESNTIRLGAQGTHRAVYIAGIAGTAVTGADVVVSSTGQLGVLVSSARYKNDIQDMGATSNGLMKLRPVTFRYREDEHGKTQYGLVAQEVEKVYPELVTYGADGKVETVRYSTLISMLLNEVQKQTRQKQELAAQMAELKASARMQIAQVQARHERELNQLRATLEERLSTIEQAMRKEDRNRPVATALEE